MQPSDLTDKQLNRAIVAKLGWKKTEGAHYDPYSGTIYGWLNPAGKRSVGPPNYPGDNNAALNDLVEPMRKKGFSFWLCASESGYFAIFWRPGGDKRMPAIPTSDGINSNPARAISEAWYNSNIASLPEND